MKKAYVTVWLALTSCTAASDAEKTQADEQALIKGPDLVVTSVRFSPAQPSPGEEVALSATLMNRGTRPTPAGTVQSVTFYVDDQPISYSDTFRGALAVGAEVAVSANGSLTVNSKVTWTARAGTVTVRAIADDVNRVVESREWNNELTQQLTIAGAAPPTSPPPPAPPPPGERSPYVPAGYVATYSDEFDRVSWSDDHVRDGVEWTDHIWYRGGFGDLDTNSPKNLAVANGLLVVTAKKEPDGTWSSGLLSSVNSNGQGFSQKYGYWEARGKFAPGDNALSTLFLMSHPHILGQVWDPFEIDAFELNGIDTILLANTVHWYDAAGHHRNDGGLGFDKFYVADWSDAFHVYGMKWDSSSISFYFDGVMTTRVPTPPSGHVAMDTMFGLYPTGWGGGPSPDATTFTSYFDYIRIYSAP